MSPGSSRARMGLLCGPGGELAFGRSLFSLREYNFLHVSNKYFFVARHCSTKPLYSVYRKIQGNILYKFKNDYDI